MEPDRAIRVLELAVCLLWVIAFYFRMQAAGRSGEPVSVRIRVAIRPILIGTWGLTVLSVVLWTQARWQPLAHAVYLPTLTAMGIAYGVMRFDAREPTDGRTKGSEGA